MTRPQIWFLTLALALWLAPSANAQDKKAPPAPAKAAGGKADPTGTWTWKVEGREGQAFESTAKLKLEGENVTGTVTGRGGNESPITEGKFSKGELTFTVTREREGRKFTSKFSGKLDGDTIKGTMSMNRGGEEMSRPWEAKRAK
jgi:hypothetical protein